MTATPVETANTLTNIYDESFAHEELAMFRIAWPQLRGIAGIPSLTETYLAEVNKSLAESGYTLIPLDDFLVVAMQTDFASTRLVPARLVEKYLPGGDKESEGKATEDDGP